jgi:arylsulfatase A-like enzyme
MICFLRRCFLAGIMLYIAAILCQCSGPGRPARPNIVIIFIDDMGYGDLSCYGNRAITTPNMDRLAENGIRFTSFYVNAPICSPSRVALNTGCYPMRYRIHSYIASSEQNQTRAMADFLDPSAATLARTLQQHGYATGHFGKWHMGGGRDLGNVPYPGAYGFDKTLVSFEGIGDRVLFPGDFLCEQSARLGRGEIIWAEKNRSTAIYVDSALAFIGRNTGKPFFVQLCPNDVHDPHLPDSAMLAGFATVTGNPWEQCFFAVLAEMDRQIGRFVDGLGELGVLDNTILILTSDNGPTDWPLYYDREQYPEGYSGELYPPGSTGRFFGRKWSLYEGGIRMPFMIRWNHQIRGGQTDETTVLAAMDLYPSILSILGMEVPSGIDGLDMSGALLGGPMERKEPVMWEYASNPGGSIQPGNGAFISPNLAIREGGWKLLINADHSDPQLFNLTDDPGEQHNLAGNEPEKVTEMAEKVIAWRKSMPVEVALRRSH